MARETVVHIMIALLSAVLILLLGVIPNDAVRAVRCFLPVLFIVLVNTYLSGPVFGVLVGIVGPVLTSVVFPESICFRDVVADIVFYTAASLAAGLLNVLLESVVRALLFGLLIGTASYGIARIVTSFVLRRSYYFMDFLNEAVIYVWPGLLLTAVGVPVLLWILNRTNAIRFLQSMRKV